MKINKLDHISINVISMDVSVRFYEKVMGFEKSSFADMGDHLIQYFIMPGGVILELLEYKYATSEHKPSYDARSIYRHIALSTNSLREVYADVKAVEGQDGVKILTEIAFNERLHFRNFLFCDPNGIEIEVIERS